MKMLTIVSLMIPLAGCGAIDKFAVRSDLTLETVTKSDMDENERSIKSTIKLNGSNRDILHAYKSAFEFTLLQLGLNKNKNQ